MANQIFSSFKELWYFCRLLTIEPYIFLFLTSYVLQKMPQDQLIQDKICRQKFSQTEQFCFDLPQMPSSNVTNSRLKSSILADVTQFNVYINLMTTIPSMVACLFIGPFIDNVRGAKRTLLLLSATMITIETLALFLNSFFFWLDYRYILAAKLIQAIVAYPVITYGSILSYVSSVTPANLRAIRLVAVELTLYTTTPFGSLVGGILLNRSPLFFGRELRNYSTVYFLAFGFSLLAILVAWWAIDEQNDRQLYRKYFPSTIDETSNEILREEEEVEEECNGSSWKVLFDLSNVRSMFGTLVRRRPHRIRCQLYLSMGALFCFLFCSVGVFAFLYEYVEKLFNWNTEQFSYYQTASFAVNVCTSMVFGPILLKVFHISDLSLSMLAMSMLFFQNLVRSMSHQLFWFNLAIGFYSLNLLSTIGLRAYISKIVNHNELGSIFSILSAMEAMVPLITSAILSTIFRHTIDTIATVPFTVLASVTTLGLVLIMVVSVNSDKTLQEINKRDNDQ